MKNNKAIFFTLIVTLGACTDKFYEQRPFNVGRPNQTFTTNFVVKKEFTYRFALIFNWLESNREIQRALIGSGDSKGLALPMNIKIIKDGKVFLDKAIQTDTSWVLESFCYNQKTGINEPRVGFWEDLLLENKPCESKPNRKLISGPSRTLEIRTLPPGRYQVEIRTLISVEQFDGMETFIDISPYSLKI